MGKTSMSSQGATVPHSVCKLLETLKRIEKAFPTKKEHKGPKATATRGGSSKKRMVAFSDQILKKSHKEAKHCTLCKKHGSMQNTHNTGDCHKYEKDGTPKKAFAWKSVQRNLRNRNMLHKYNISYMQLSAKIAKLEKSSKKLKHANKPPSRVKKKEESLLLEPKQGIKKKPRIKPSRDLNTLLGVALVMQPSKFY